MYILGKFLVKYVGSLADVNSCCCCTDNAGVIVNPKGEMKGILHLLTFFSASGHYM